MAEIALQRRHGPGNVGWRAAILAGLISGAVFLMLEMLLVPLLLDGIPWGPPRMIAAIVMGPGVLPPPAAFSPGVIMVAMAVHFALLVAFAVILAALIARAGFPAALAVGAVFGLALYVVNFYGMTAVFPWFAMARNWLSIVAHLVFGVVAAWAYVVLRPSQPRPVDH